MTRTEIHSVYWGTGMLAIRRIIHLVAEVSGKKGHLIVKAHASFDHLGAAKAFERSLRAFLKEQARVRAREC